MVQLIPDVSPHDVKIVKGTQGTLTVHWYPERRKHVHTRDKTGSLPIRRPRWRKELRQIFV